MKGVALSRLARRGGGNLLLAAVYLVTARLGMELALPGEHVTPIWPPVGIALAALLLWGRFLWPGIWLGSFSANLLNGASPALALVMSTGSVLAPVIGAELLRRLRFRPALERPVGVVMLVVAGAAAPAVVSATIGASAIASLGAPRSGVVTVWATWWIGDVMGAVLVAPLLLTIAKVRPYPLGERPLEATVLVLSAIGGAWLTFMSGLSLEFFAPVFFLAVPAAAAVRFQQAGAAVVIFIVSGMALAAIITADSLEQPVMTAIIGAQVFNLGLAVTILTLGTVMRQRLLAERELRHVAAALEDRVSQRTVLLGESQRLARIGSFRWDAATNTNEWTDELYRMYGMTPQEVAPSFERYMAKVHPDHAARIQEAVERSMRTGEPFDHEYPIVHPSGEERWVHAYGEVVIDAEGNLAAIQGTCQDVTERKRSERVIRANEERARTLIEFAHDAFISIDADGVITEWNVKAESMFGWPRDEAVGRPLVDTVVPPAYRQAHLNGLARFLSTGEGPMLNRPIELVALHRDGREFPVELAIWATLDGSGRSFHSFIRDIGERKEAENALRASEERFKALIESAPDAFIVVDAGGKIVLVNDQATTLFGYTTAEMVGQPVELLVPEGLEQRHSGHRAEYLAHPSRRKMGSGLKLWATRKDGTQVPVDVSLSPVPTPEGVLVVAGVRDVTVQRQAEETLRAAYEREREAVEHLRALDETKTVFLEAISHELRTPLTVILGVATLLQSGDLNVHDERFPELLSSLGASARRLHSLLDDLLDLDRLRRGVVEPRRRPTAVADLMAHVIEQIDTGNHPVHLDAHEVVANVDPSQTERIVENLLSNAFKHTPPGTPVWVRAEAKDGGVLIVVEDAGPGVSAKLGDKLFDPFVKDTRAHIAGTGIGLSLVDRFAKLHGGKAWVEERPGGGASFRVHLPGPTRTESGTAA